MSLFIMSSMSPSKSISGSHPSTRFYQASTSELYGKVQEVPQTESTPFYPRSPYACAKIYSYWAVVNYREAYNMYCVNGVLFNHESPRRGGTFVTKKVTAAVAAIKAGQQDRLVVGNLHSLRDWGHARDYVRGMWMMLQKDSPDEYVLATGKQYSVHDFTSRCFKYVDMPLTWRGSGLAEEGIDAEGNVRVCVSEKYFRPTEVETLLGDASKAKRELGWEPEIDLDGLIDDMMKSDIAAQKKGSNLVSPRCQPHGSPSRGS